MSDRLAELDAMIRRESELKKARLRMRRLYAAKKRERLAAKRRKTLRPHRGANWVRERALKRPVNVASSPASESAGER